MSIFMQRPQFMDDILLNIGSYLARPQDLHEGDGISPGVDSELVEEVGGTIDTLIHDDGASGFVLVQEA